MLDYQRDIDMAFVEEKSRDGVFDENEVSIILISVRPDGSMKVCDGQHTIAIGLEGSPGIGKTAIIKEIAEERNAKFVRVELSSMEEIGD